MTPDNIELVGLVFSVSLNIFSRVQKLNIINFNADHFNVCMYICKNV